MRHLIYIIAILLCVGCEAGVMDSGHIGNDNDKKPIQPIKRRPIGKDEIQRPRYTIINPDGGLDWSNISIWPHSVTVRSVESGQEVVIPLEHGQEYIEFDPMENTEEYIIIIEGEEFYFEERFKWIE